MNYHHLRSGEGYVFSCVCSSFILFTGRLAHPLHASKGQIIIINQLKSIYNSLFEDAYSHPIHTCFLIIARNGFNLWQMNVGTIDLLAIDPMSAM